MSSQCIIILLGMVKVNTKKAKAKKPQDMQNLSAFIFAISSYMLMPDSRSSRNKRKVWHICRSMGIY